MSAYFAMIAAWTGEKDLAIERRRSTQSLRTFLHRLGLLKTFPFWDPLRGDPLRENRRRARAETMI
jgi:hypothetical protein